MQLSIVLVMLWACSYSEAVKPTILLANGTALLDNQVIYIHNGEPLELFCTGDGHKLLMTDYGTPIPTTSVNKTTIRLCEEITEIGNYIYSCEYIKSDAKDYDYDYHDASYLGVQVESVPVTENFRCKSINLEYLNCSWTLKMSTSYAYPARLYYDVNDGNPIILCKKDWLNYDYNIYGDIHNMFCVWDKSHPLLPYQTEAENLTFIMNTCSHVSCMNQTFGFDHRVIVQPEPPYLELLSKSSYGVRIGLQVNLVLYNLKLTLFKKKISYWYSGIHENEPVVSTTNFSESYYDESELVLPCANKFYEVRVSVRPHLAVGEGFWSDDAVIRFVTDLAPDDEGAVDPTCDEPRAMVTRDVMLYLTDQLKVKIKEEQNELKMKIKALKLKAGRR